MSDVVYKIVEHDGGWAYKLGDVFSETFPTREDAESAAQRVASEQRVPGETEAIEWEDEEGIWHEETARGDDRPDSSVESSIVPAWTQHDAGRVPSSSLFVSLLLVGAAGALIATIVQRRRT